MKMVIIANSIKINSIFCNSTKLANQALIKESDRSLSHTPLVIIYLELFWNRIILLHTHP